MELSRRALLIGLAASAPMASVLSSAAPASEADSDLLRVSRIIVGREDLQPAIAARVQEALTGRIEGFADKLARLASALGDGSNRDAALAALDEENLDLALAIAKPWYLGVVGAGAEHGFDDDAVFITYLGAQSLALVKDVVPLQSFSTGRPGWWAEPPEGVTPPPMPAEVRSWDFVPEGATGVSAPASPVFLALVTPKPAKSDGTDTRPGQSLYSTD